MIPEFTIVLGVDEAHISHLEASFPTWMKNKPSLKKHPVQIFLDRDVQEKEHGERILHAVNKHPDVRICSWPIEGDVTFDGIPGDRWSDPQRVKMLSGFIYVAAEYIETPYWLKIDLDTIATGNDDWIDPSWFEDDPAIISAPWSYSKPADQMLKLDRWMQNNERDLLEWTKNPPLNLIPKAGSDIVRHHRIISWCAFFNTEFTKKCVEAAQKTCGLYQMPVPSQDGYLWYMAKRGGYEIKTPPMKRFGWGHWKTLSTVREKAREAMNV